MFLGGAATTGGKGTIVGTFLAVILVGVLNNGMNLVGVDTFYQRVALGVLLIGAVAVAVAPVTGGAGPHPDRRRELMSGDVVGGRLEHGTWGSWPTVRLATPFLELEVVSEIGARVISLRDKRRDREWLFQGRLPSEQEGRDWSAEGAVFGGRESFGWDECLPTVAPCADARDGSAPPLRDHGDQWGRGAIVRLDEEAGILAHAWSTPRWPYRLSRRLSCPAGDTVLAEYVLTSLAADALPFLWSAHPVFALEPGCRIDLPGVERVRRTSQLGIDLPSEATWPMATTATGDTVDLGLVHPGAGWAVKAYATPPGPVSMAAPDGARLTVDWISRPRPPHWGSGWPLVAGRSMGRPSSRSPSSQRPRATTTSPARSPTARRAGWRPARPRRGG